MQIRRVIPVDEIDLSPREFWTRPHEEREGAFATLREECPVHRDVEYALEARSGAVM